MKLLALHAGLLLSAASAFGQRLDIYLNTNDCINCTAALAQLSGLDTAIHVNLYADEAQKRFMPELLGRFGATEPHGGQLTYIPQADILREAPVGSVCRFHHGARKPITFDLKALGANLGHLNQAVRCYEQRVELPCRLRDSLSDRVGITVVGKHIVLDDYLLARSLIGFLGGTDSVRFDRFALNQSFIKDYLTAIGKDTIQYDSLYHYLKVMGQTSTYAVSASSFRDSLVLAVEVKYPDVDSVPGYEPSVMIQSYPVFVTLAAGEVTNWRRCDWAMPDTTMPYLMHINRGFYMTDSLVYIRLVNINHGDRPEDIMGAYRPKGNSIEWARHVWAMTPERMEKGANPEHSYNGAFNGSLYHLGIYPFLCDPARNRTYDLAAAIEKVDKGKYFTKDHKSLFWMHDAAWTSSDEITAVYTREKEKLVRIVTYSTLENRVTRLILKDLSDVDAGTARLLEDGRLICLSSNKRSLVVFR